MTHYIFALLKMGEYKKVENFIEGRKSAGLNSSYLENLYHGVKGDLEKMTDKEETWTNVLLEKKEVFFDFMKEFHADPLSERNSYLAFKLSSSFDYLRDDSGFEEVLQKEKERYEELMRKYGELPF